MGRSQVIESVRLHDNRLEQNTDSPVIVLIHGSMDRQAAFARMARLLSTSSQVVTFDRRGYGKSVEQRGTFSVDEQVSDLDEIIGQFAANQKVILVGHSFGGVVALAYAQRFVGSIAGLVIYESPMSWEPWWPKDSGGSAAVAAADDPEYAAETFMRRFIGHRRWEALPDSTKKQRRSEGEALVGELGDIRRIRPWDIELVQGPLIAGFGSKSKPHLQASAELLGNLDDCRSIKIEGAHHNAHSASPDDFVELLIQPLVRRVIQGTWS
jgi:pimeloyl-ACP methyl ester carboxylesterase